MAKLITFTEVKSFIKKYNNNLWIYTILPSENIENIKPNFIKVTNINEHIYNIVELKGKIIEHYQDETYSGYKINIHYNKIIILAYDKSQDDVFTFNNPKVIQKTTHYEDILKHLFEGKFYTNEFIRIKCDEWLYSFHFEYIFYVNSDKIVVSHYCNNISYIKISKGTQVKISNFYNDKIGNLDLLQNNLSDFMMLINSVYYRYYGNNKYYKFIHHTN